MGPSPPGLVVSNRCLRLDSGSVTVLGAHHIAPVFSEFIFGRFVVYINQFN